jgi:hypothetical protein
MLTLIPTRLIAYGVVVLLLFISGFGIGHHLEAEKFNAYKAKVLAQALAQKKINEATTLKYQTAVKESQDETTYRIADVHAYYKRLYSATNSVKPSEGSETIEGSDGYSPDHLPNTKKLAEDCAITTVQVLGLQEYINRIAE